MLKVDNKNNESKIESSRLFKASFNIYKTAK